MVNTQNVSWTGQVCMHWWMLIRAASKTVKLMAVE